ncbi:MAG: hypothetical protein IPJ82_11985 [Lewinellaceae bacterium]|nr:hypothetical protein [Lewinellaceae bacterium]
MTVLFGKSGYGKSSLLHAGLVPDLKNAGRAGKWEYVPVNIRLYTWDEHRNTRWLDRIRVGLDQSLPEIEGRQYLPPTIWGELKKRQQEPTQVFVLIFDQFEEFFSFPEQQRDEFKTQLAELLYADIPDYLEHNEDDHTADQVKWMTQRLDVKVVFSIRSDKLSELDRLKDQLPAILHKRYELRPLQSKQACEALEMPAQLSPADAEFASALFRWTPDALQSAIARLSSGKHGREAGIESFQLQILAQNVEQQVIEGKITDRDGDGMPDVTVADLPDIEGLYENFYEDGLKRLSIGERKKASRLIEKGLIFEADNQRINLHEKLVLKNFGVDTKLVQKLVDLRLLRAEYSASMGYNIELSHDAFVHPVLNSARKRKNKAVKRGLIAAGLALGAVIVSLGAYIIAREINLKYYSTPIVAEKIAEANETLKKKLDSIEMEVVRSQSEKLQLTLKFDTIQQKLDSIKTIAGEEDRAKKLILQYFDCVNSKDVGCMSDLSARVYEKYYRADNLPTPCII